MEDGAGLGNHIRHDAITGAAAALSESNRTAKVSLDHATVFVSASAADAKDIDVSSKRHDEHQRTNGSSSINNGNQNLTNTPRLSQHPPPSFPLPPPGPPVHAQPQQQTLPIPAFRPPPAPPPPSMMLPPFPPPPVPPHPTNAQSAVPFPPLHAVNLPPPPGLPPKFPLPPGFPPNVIPPPVAPIASHTIAPATQLPPQHIASIISSSVQQNFNSSLQQQPHEVPASGNISHNNMHSSTQQHQYYNSTNSSNTTLQNTTSEQNQPQTQSSTAIEKARAIALRFQTESITPDTTIPIDNYKSKRLAHFQKEQSKLSKFRLKNLEYVMHHDEMELRRHVDCMNQITAYEEKQSIQFELVKQQQIQRQIKLDERKQQKVQMDIMSGGGIGSRDQRRAEKVRKRERLEGGTSHVNKSNAQRNSLYLTSLPTDGSTTERILHSLFSSYGRLDRVTMYRDRKTGELKGDGLIVFGRDAVEAYSKTEDGNLVDAVCLQMNGAELPCGTAMGVEPADMNYGKKSKSESSAEAKETGEVETKDDVRDDFHKENVDNTAAKKDDAEDLDDFFASLE